MAFDSIDGVFDAFKKLKVLIIGDAMIDTYTYGEVRRMSPEAPVPVLTRLGQESRLGGAANVALNIQALGATPILCTVIGQDDAGAELIQLLKSQDISSEGVVLSKNRPTTVKNRIVAGSQQLLRIDRESEESLDMSERGTLLERITRMLAESDMVIFQDYDKGCLNGSLIAEIIELARQRLLPIAVDPKQKNFWAYSGATLFKPNLQELRSGLKRPELLADHASLLSAADSLQRRMEVGSLLVTLSGKGIYYHTSEEHGVIPAHLRSIADVSGAGDTVIAVASLCHALGLSMRIVAELANLGGGIACEHQGVVPVDKDRLRSEAHKGSFF